MVGLMSAIEARFVRPTCAARTGCCCCTVAYRFLLTAEARPRGASSVALTERESQPLPPLARSAIVTSVPAAYM